MGPFIEEPLIFVITNSQNLSSIEESTNMFAEHQHSTVHLIQELKHLDNYRIPLAQPSTESNTGPH